MTSQTFASIITIGDELLIGQVIDTNSAFIAQQLNKTGIAVKHRLAVGDDYDDIWAALDEEKKLSDIIIITGGLGPTADDITKPLLCEYFGGKMILHHETLEHVKHLFANVLKRPMIERNAKQAEVPDNCIVLKNEVGTAPAMMFEQNNKLFFALPGVPHEMKWITNNHIVSIIQKKYNNTFIEHRTLMTAGVGESFIAEKLIDFENNLPQQIRLAYLPNYGMVRLRLTAQGNNKDVLTNIIDEQFLYLQSLVGDVMVTNKDETIVEMVSNLLLQSNATISLAESCTGGYLAHLFTSNAGSSNYFKGSIVAYANAVKQNVLNVDEKLIVEHGAVSEPVVTEMAKNILQKMNTDYSIAISGIMGPDGGTKEKPVGTVWMAVACSQKIKTKLLQLRFDRKKNIELAATNALLLIRELIVDKH